MLHVIAIAQCWTINYLNNIMDGQIATNSPWPAASIVQATSRVGHSNIYKNLLKCSAKLKGKIRKSVCYVNMLEEHLGGLIANTLLPAYCWITILPCRSNNVHNNQHSHIDHLSSYGLQFQGINKVLQMHKWHLPKLCLCPGRRALQKLPPWSPWQLFQ